jgi:hypothetical protein
MSLIQKPVFVVGVPRSGTTLLSTILSTSPDLSVAPEIWFFNYWVKKYSFLDFNKEKDYLFFVDIFLNSNRFKYLELDKEKIRKRIVNQEQRSFPIVISAVLKAYAEKFDKPLVGEKTPGQFKNIEGILQAFPDCKIIGMLRSPYAVAASTLKAGFASNANILTVAKRWKNYIHIINKYGDNQKVKIVRYEDLVTFPQKTSKDIADFLKINFQPETALKDRQGSYSLGKRKDNSWANMHLSKSLKPVNTDSLYKWRQNLDDIDIQLINYIIGAKEITNTGYLLESPDKVLSQSQLNSLLIQKKITGKISNLKKKGNLFNNRTVINKLSYKLFGKVYEIH